MSIDLGRAARATAALVKDPDDTAQVFALIEALSGNRTPGKVARRLRGSRLLEERPAILAHLGDRASLARLAEGSLGRAYLRFVETEGITAEGLLAASARAERFSGGDPVVAYVRERLRDVHDLWHVVLGYGTDLVGEAAVLAFTFAQTRNAALGVLVGVGLVKLSTAEARRVIIGALARGARAAWLPGEEWERLLPRPLEELRRALRVGAAPVYAPIRAE